MGQKSTLQKKKKNDSDATNPCLCMRADQMHPADRLLELCVSEIDITVRPRFLFESNARIPHVATIGVGYQSLNKLDVTAAGGILPLCFLIIRPPSSSANPRHSLHSNSLRSSSFLWFPFGDGSVILPLCFGHPVQLPISSPAPAPHGLGVRGGSVRDTLRR